MTHEEKIEKFLFIISQILVVLAKASVYNNYSSVDTRCYYGEKIAKLDNEACKLNEKANLS